MIRTNFEITIPETWLETTFTEWMYNLEQKLKESRLN